MNTLDPQTRINYIRSLTLDTPKLAPAPKGGLLEITDDAPSAYVSAGNVVSFVAGLTAQQKQDVLNSTLLAQLGANKAFDRETQLVDWYKKYREVLENVGWVLGSFDFSKYSTSGSTFAVEKVVLEIVLAIASENALLVTTSALTAIRNLSAGSKAFTIWDSTTHSASNGNFQVSPCQNSDGNVAMSIAALHFSANTVDSQFLWFSYKSSDISLYKGGQTIVLNDQVYSQVRADVIKRLGDRAQTYVASLDI